MNKEQITKIVESGESDTVELKQNFDKDVFETVCAFANTKGGNIIIGINDKKMVKGIQLGKESINNWINQISQTIEPKPRLKVEKLFTKDKPIAILQISESQIKPVSFKGRYYKRVSSTNRQMNWEDITKLVLESVGTTWDEIQETRAEINDIDTEKVKKFIQLCNTTGRRPVPATETPLDVLRKLELIKDNKPTRAAIL